MEDVSMEPRSIKGSKQEIIEQIARMEEEIQEVIVFVREPGDPKSFSEELAAMEPWPSLAPGTVDDSREAIYRRMKGE
jgi:hypothetical protein